MNFGLFTTIWDRMLGTAVYDPDRHFTSDDLGIGKEHDYPDAYFAQLIQPFKTPTNSDAQVSKTAAE